MSKLNLSLLRELYLIHSPSFREYQMSDFVQARLKEIGVPFEVEKSGLIYGFNSQDKPLLSAHMDQVQRLPCREVLVRAGGSILCSETGLGADDKNGIFIVLEMLRLVDKNLNFIFSVQEEVGSPVLEQFLSRSGIEDLNIPYALVFDRKGWGDIIGSHNHYCVKDLENDIADLGFGYSPAMGVFSDADMLCNYVSCVNLSCGYFSAHSAEEFTVVPALVNAFELGAAIVSKLKRTYPKPTLAPVSAWRNTSTEDTYCPYCFASVSYTHLTLPTIYSV